MESCSVPSQVLSADLVDKSETTRAEFVGFSAWLPASPAFLSLLSYHSGVSIPTLRTVYPFLLHTPAHHRPSAAREAQKTEREIAIKQEHHQHVSEGLQHAKAHLVSQRVFAITLPPRARGDGEGLLEWGYNHVVRYDCGCY